MEINPALETRNIPVTIDKSHLVTIGEKLYPEKSSFIRELVNNAYDADATEVHVTLNPQTVIIRGNGTGMDEHGLRQYFTIGSSYKKENTTSHRLQRQRIGEFGIGKFAALAVCQKFEIDTQRDNFHAHLVFDKEAWSLHEDWHLNIDILPASPARGNGTVITLQNVSVNFIPGKIRRYLAERTPINVPDFAVYVNRERVTSDIVAGKRIALNIQTIYGKIEGTIIIASAAHKNTQIGLGVSVKNVLIRYETFGLDTVRKLGASRIAGIINADFLPIASSRDEFLRDDPKFLLFTEAIKKEIKKALAFVKEEVDEKANIQASRILKDALSRIGKAMKFHKDLFPETQVAMGSATKPNDPEAVKGFEISKAKFVPSQQDLTPDIQDRPEDQQKKKGRGRPSAILGDKSVIRSLKIAGLDIAVRLEHLSQEEESLVSGGVIYINLDHPLYRTYQSDDNLLTQHIARITTKELALKSGVRDAEQAFLLQSTLLTEALQNSKDTA